MDEAGKYLSQLPRQVALVCFSAFFAWGGVSARADETLVVHSHDNALSRPLSDLPPNNEPGSVKESAPVRHPPAPDFGSQQAQPGKPSEDPTKQTEAKGEQARPKAKTRFPGLGASGYYPADANIAVGKSSAGAGYIMQAVNLNVSIYTKAGVQVLAPTALSAFWATLGGPCGANTGGSDPIVMYDAFANRWIISQMANVTSPSGPYYECIAVSRSSDPRGSYYQYAFNFGSSLNDYPKLGVWPTATNSAYLGTYNLFLNGSTFQGAALCAYDRMAMISGATSITAICRTISNDASYLPADVDGATPPADGTPPVFMTYETLSSLRLYQMTGLDFAHATTTLASRDIAVAAFSEACGGGACIPQPGTSQTLDSLGDRPMYRLAYRVFSDHTSMVVNHSVTAGSSVGVRWYELRKSSSFASRCDQGLASGFSSSSFYLCQQGTYAPDAKYRWMGSAAMDGLGNIAIGYSVSSASTYPSNGIAARTPGMTANTLGSETILVAGGGSQLGASRWGDYSTLRVDPDDDATFWFTSEYYTTSSSYSWSTSINSFAVAASSAFVLSVTKGGSGSGTVSSSPTGISCGTTCSATFAPNTSVTLSAAASAGSTFTGWSGACSGTAPSCTVTMTSALSVTANFSASASYPVTVTKSGTGSGLVTSSPVGINCGSTCSASFASGASVTLTASAAAGSNFAGWGGACSGSSTTCVISVSGAAGVTATFNASSAAALSNAVAVGNLSGAAGSSAAYSLSVPAGATNLQFATAGGSGNVDIYVNRGAPATTSVYTCRSVNAGTVEGCFLGNVTAATTYYVTLVGSSSYSGVSMIGAFTTSAVSVSPLVNGVPRTSLSGKLSAAYYSIFLPNNASNMLTTTAGGAGEVDLYVKRGDVPTLTSFDCRPYLAGNNESCAAPSPGAGIYYIMLNTPYYYYGVTLTSSYSAN